MKSDPEIPLVGLDPQNPPKLPAGHPDASDELDVLRELVGEAQKQMHQLAETVTLSETEGAMFYRVWLVLRRMGELVGSQGERRDKGESNG